MKFPKIKVGKLWEYLKSIPHKIKECFLIEDGQKKKLNLKLMGLVGVPVILVGSFLSYIWENADTSYLNQSSERLSYEMPSLPTQNQNKLADSLVREESETARLIPKTGHSIKIRYSARQVIDRFGQMAAETNFIGKLMTAIDTRYDGQAVKVLLPYGVTYQGTKNIENGSILFGSARYAGSGDRVYVQFSRLVKTDGSEYPIQAQALNSKDFSPGLSGDLHTNLDSRMMATIGLSMLSAGSDVLVEKESLGQSFEATPKSTLKNAAMKGISRGAQMEAERRMQDVESQEPYVIVDSGCELIVSLTETFKGELTQK